MNSFPVFFLCFMMPFVVSAGLGINSGPSIQIPHHSFQEIKNKSQTASRNLFLHGTNYFPCSCSNKDISVSQSKEFTSGIPRYVVQIANTCVSGCAPHDIHLLCGWFASARLINPRFFKRISYDDCLVNGGNPLATGEVIRFTYYNSFMYPLALKSAKFC